MRALSSGRRPNQAGARAVLVAACLLAACASEPPPATFPVTFIARADEPLPGVEISVEGGRPLGSTGADGLLRATLVGREGLSVPFRVSCPAGYRAPREMPALTLRRFVGLDPAAAARGVEVTIQCRPAERMAALVVRAGQPDLPVLARGREIARTNADGVAHALVRLPPNSTFRVVLDTSGDPALRPQNPATTLALGDGDEIFVIDQSFEQSREPAPRERPRRRRNRKKPPVEKPPVEKPPVEKPTGPEKLK